MLRCFAALLLIAVSTTAAAVSSAALRGDWEAARAPDGERLYVRLLRDGKAQIVREYDFQLPGQPGVRRGRSTAYAKWAVQKDEVVLTYGPVRDRLRYAADLPLTEIGRTGTAAGLKPIGKPDPRSRIGNLILWKAPHDYRMKAPATPANRE